MEEVEVDKPSTAQRKCTDICGLLFCIIFVAALLGCVSYAFLHGDLKRITTGFDDCGYVCGQKNELLKKEILDEINQLKHTFLKDECNDSDRTKKPLTEHVYGEEHEWSCTENCNETTHQLIFNRCFEKTHLSKTIAKGLTGSAVQERALDLFETWHWILATCCAAVVFSFVLLILFRYAIKYVIWIIIIGVIVALIAGAIVMFVLYFTTKEEKGQGKNTYVLLGGIVLGLSAVIFSIIICCFRERIQMVVQIFKEASKAIADVPLLLVEPLLTFLAITLTCFLFLFFAITIESAGNIGVERKDNNKIKKIIMVRDSLMIGAQISNVVAFLWFTSFILGCQNFVIAGTISQWYFVRTKSKIEWPIARSFKNLLCFHIGSVCLGSVLLTIIKVLRIIVTIIMNRLNASDNFLCKCLVCCCACMMRNLETFFNYLVRNAIIVIALNGTPLFTSGKIAFNLIGKHFIDFVALNRIGDFIMLLGKIFVTLVCGFLGYELISKVEAVKVIWLPVTICVLFSYLIVDCFMTVFEMTVDTIFICYCEDVEQNDGVNRPYYMSSKMMKVMQSMKGETNVPMVANEMNTTAVPNTTNEVQKY